MAASGEVELGWLCEVVARHTPTFYLHPADRYMPCPADFFLRHSELRQAAAGAQGSAVLLPRGAVAGPLLLEAQEAAAQGSRMWLDLDPEARPGYPREHLGEVPVYAHPKLVLDHGGGVEALEVTYITLYAYNGEYRVGGVGLIKTGAHDGDWEHCTARIHPTSGELLGMWYNAHRSRDGCWVAGREVPRDPQTGRVAAYVALHGHGTYPRPGRVLRHFFLGNDLCSGDGPVWRPRRVILLPPLHQGGAATGDGTHLPSPIGASGPHAAVQLDEAQAEDGEQGDGQELVAAAETGLQSISLAEAPAEQAAAAADGGSSGAAEANGSSANRGGAASMRRQGSRKLVQVLSRGSSLSSANGNGASNGGNDGASNGTAAGASPAAPGMPGNSNGRNGGTAGSGEQDSKSGLPEVVVDDPCEWLFFRGQWGTTDAPICQPWFHRAEPPLSRTTLLRLFGHFVPEPA